LRTWKTAAPLSHTRLVAAAVMGAAFLAVLSPYLAANKRTFGHYFYNVNTTFYVWYDDWPQASVGTIKHGDGIGWPDMPPDALPSASRYWREHTIGQITGRIAAGLHDMIVRSYRTYWYFKYVVLYTLVALAVIARRRADVASLVRTYPALVTFLVLYAVVYVVAIAFYAPVSGTGTTRFLLAHVLPYLFMLSWLFDREPFCRTEWRARDTSVTIPHVHLLVSAILVSDLIFTFWPRLMTTYGGF